MQKEDLHGYEERSHFLIDQLNFIRTELRTKSEELSQILSQKYALKSLAEREKKFGDEKLHISSLKNKISKKMDIFQFRIESDISIKEKRGLHVSLSPYCLQPSFYSFIAERFPKFRKSDTQLETFSLKFISQIRAILDSYYCEFINCGTNFEKIPKCCDYVYWWLGSFTTDCTEHKIVQIHDPLETEPNLLKFYSYLSQFTYRKLWDVSVFVSMIEERLSLDEIFFYLHCRNLVFQGPQLASSAAFLTIVHHYPLREAQRVVKLLFGDSRDITVSEIVMRLEKKAEKKFGESYLDGYYFLRILLEFYIHEKRCKLGRLKTAFKSKLKVYFEKKIVVKEKEEKFEDDKNNFNKHGDEKLGSISSSFDSKEQKNETKNTNEEKILKISRSMSFETFGGFLEEFFPKLDNLEIVQLFRLAWSFGNGEVSFYSFVAAAHELKLFLKTLKLPTQASYHQNQKEIKIDTQNYYFKNIEDLIENSLQKNKNKLFWLIQTKTQSPSIDLIRNASMLNKICSGSFKFLPEQYSTLGGDYLNFIVEKWIVLLKALLTTRSVLIVPIKHQNQLCSIYASTLEQYLLKSFDLFLQDLKLINIEKKNADLGSVHFDKDARNF